MRKLLVGLVASTALLAGAARAADAIPYPDTGSYNPVTYTFTAAADGDLVAFIVGGFTASYENQLGVLVNGVAQGGFGLDNHSSSSGDSFDFGAVHAGDSLVFVLNNLTLGALAYSDPSLNAAYDDPSYTGGHNHIYSTPYTATPPIGAVPPGTYVAFEDLQFPNSDFNYNDESFVFTNVGATTHGGVPEPAAWALMLLGFGGVGAVLRRRVAIA
jgi:hypothetical protein